ncbi:MAG: hypothetical protein LKJ17_09460 [Oscillospiraceae bacterium]|jgi:hypothetical protein|nr:hypothetical protein [Oscillospiraceae bacterium]
MQYRVVLRIQVQENHWIKVGDDHKTLWEIRGLIEDTSGWVLLNQEKLGSTESLVPMFEKGILRLQNSPDSYLSYEAIGGMGTIQNTVEFYQNLMKDCREHPYAELYGEIAT